MFNTWREENSQNTLFYTILPSFPVPDIDRSIDESNLIFLQTEIEREIVVYQARPLARGWLVVNQARPLARGWLVVYQARPLARGWLLASG